MPSVNKTAANKRALWIVEKHLNFFIGPFYYPFHFQAWAQQYPKKLLLQRISDAIKGAFSDDELQAWREALIGEGDCAKEQSALENNFEKVKELLNSHPDLCEVMVDPRCEAVFNDWEEHFAIINILMEKLDPLSNEMTLLTQPDNSELLHFLYQKKYLNNDSLKMLLISGADGTFKQYSQWLMICDQKKSGCINDEHFDLLLFLIGSNIRLTQDQINMIVKDNDILTAFKAMIVMFYDLMGEKVFNLILDSISFRSALNILMEKNIELSKPEFIILCGNYNLQISISYLYNNSLLDENVANFFTVFNTEWIQELLADLFLSGTKISKEQLQLLTDSALIGKKYTSQEARTLLEKPNSDKDKDYPKHEKFSFGHLDSPNLFAPSTPGKKLELHPNTKSAQAATI